MPRTHDERPNHAKHPESEAAFLRRQAAQAKAAIAQTAKDMGTNLGHAIDVRLWTKDHPWSMIAAAVVGGFAAAATLVPSEEQQALSKLRKIEEALHLDALGEKAEKKAKTTAEADGKAKPAAAEPKGIMATLMREAMSLVRPILSSAIAGAVGSQVAAQQGQGAGNGHVAAAQAGTGAGLGESQQ